MGFGFLCWGVVDVREGVFLGGEVKGVCWWFGLRDVDIRVCWVLVVSEQ